MELLEAGDGSDAIVFTTTELIVEAPVASGGSCAGAEEDGWPGPATPPGAVDEGEPDPEATLAGGSGEAVSPLTGVPESAPAAVVPGDEQIGVGPPTAPEAPELAADPTGAEHDAPEVSPDEITVGPLPEGAVPVVDGVVADEDGEAVVGDDGGVVADEDGGMAADGDGAVVAPEAVPGEQAVDPVASPPAVETFAVL